MKIYRLLLLLVFSLLFHLHLFAYSECTVDSIVYRLYDTQERVNSIDYAPNTAMVRMILSNTQRAVVHRHITNNGKQYEVKYINFTQSSSELNSKLYDWSINVFEIEDSVNCEFISGWFTAGPQIHSIVLGKGVRLRGLGQGLKGRFEGSGGPKNDYEGDIYCYDDKPMPALGPNGFLFPFYYISTIYVPKGSERDYKNAVGWGYFENIVGSEELGDLTVPVVTGDSFNFNQKSAIIDTNSDAILPVILENKNDILSLDFDIQLPEDIKLVDGDFIIASGRANGATTTTIVNDNILHVFLAMSPLSAGKGEIASLGLQADKSGSYSLLFTNIKVTTVSGQVIDLDDSELQFVANHKKGDYNEDGNVNTTDVQDLFDYVMGIN